MQKSIKYKDCLGSSKIIKTFRKWKKELKKQGPINPSQVNLLRKKNLLLFEGKDMKVKYKVEILGFAKVTTTFEDRVGTYNYILYEYDYIPNYISSNHPGDCLMYGDRVDSNYFKKLNKTG